MVQCRACGPIDNSTIYYPNIILICEKRADFFIFLFSSPPNSIQRIKYNAGIAVARCPDPYTRENGPRVSFIFRTDDRKGRTDVSSRGRVRIFRTSPRSFGRAKDSPPP